MDNLDVARQMETEGKEPLAIKQATGWERGADGKWRYEIPDMMDNADYSSLMSVYTSSTLGEMLGKEHPLIKAYPTLASTRISFDSRMPRDTRAQAVAFTNEIRLNSSIYNGLLKKHRKAQDNIDGKRMNIEKSASNMSEPKKCLSRAIGKRLASSP